MAYVLRPLSIAALLDTTFDIYRKNFVLFVGISAIPNIALLLLKLLLLRATSGGTIPFGATVLLGFASLFVGSIVTAATTFGVSDVYLDIPTNVRACFSRVARKALPVVVVSFLVGLIVGFGLLLCIIPGIYWTGKYGIAVPAVVLEDITASEALGRSSSLTEGAVGRVILISLLTSIFIFIIAAALYAGVEALDAALFHGRKVLSGGTSQELMSVVVSTLLDPVSAIALTLVYYDQRVRNEAFDIERLMSMMASGNLGSSASAS